MLAGWLPSGRGYFHYFLRSIDSTPNSKFEKVSDGYAVTQAQFKNDRQMSISKPLPTVGEQCYTRAFKPASLQSLRNHVPGK